MIWIFSISFKWIKHAKSRKNFTWNSIVSNKTLNFKHMEASSWWTNWRDIVYSQNMQVRFCEEDKGSTVIKLLWLMKALSDERISGRISNYLISLLVWLLYHLFCCSMLPSPVSLIWCGSNGGKEIQGGKVLCVKQDWVTDVLILTFCFLHSKTKKQSRVLNIPMLVFIHQFE